MPVVLTILLGGIAASVIFPRIQSKYQSRKDAAQRRNSLAEQVIPSFTRYIVRWRRLIEISRYEEEHSLDVTGQERKRRFVEDRNSCRDELLDNLRLCQLHFSKSVIEEIDSFIDWDESHASSTLDELPTVAEWRSRERAIVELLKAEL